MGATASEGFEVWDLGRLIWASRFGWTGIFLLPEFVLEERVQDSGTTALGLPRKKVYQLGSRSGARNEESGIGGRCEVVSKHGDLEGVCE